MNKRIFIAINLPDQIKHDLLSHSKRWPNLRVRWTSFYNLHITLEFLGNTDKRGLDNILSAVQKTASAFKPFDVWLDKIVLGPNLNEPTMFWATIFIDQNIMKLKNLLDENMRTMGFNLDNREFNPHITLARAKGNQLKGKKTNIILKDIGFNVKSVEVMQSQLHASGSRYEIAESFNLEGIRN